MWRISLRMLKISYSQFHEDYYIKHILDKNDLTFIDIGANHPIKFNNTYLFYINGARGVNIEPNPLIIEQFNIFRPNDINLNIGLGKKAEFKKFYVINPDVNSTFDDRKISQLLSKGCQLVSKPKIKIDTLESVFKKYLKTNYVDIISIDTEGYDYQILQSNNWKINRCKIIIIESNSKDTKRFLKKNGYKFLKQFGLNHIYVDNSQ